ncbi:ABC transporter G family member 20-like [Antedon mediterranea]|uniref:ABC transporter G family member 20-like n=1 Tax=Antedon mediterranea TaxID=105859 RepID=UPI003AF436AE
MAEKTSSFSNRVRTPIQSTLSAIVVKNVYQHYGSGRGRLDVLKGIKMQVPQGSIYGLLGSSGCGKTTLLRCCLGRLSFEKGTIITCGKPPLSKGHGIPGPMVGYMPQETALYGEFSIKETMKYFGILHGMKSDEIVKQRDFLIDLLRLPPAKSIVGNLSGGQKRRVSFAVALLHSPPLLILDEPTVGVDPLLRMKIWEHLGDIARGGETTIIITTHYIEEAKQAHIVGLMRNGVLLSESPPLELIAHHRLNSLEEVFLKLCMREVTAENEEASADLIVKIDDGKNSAKQTEKEEVISFQNGITNSSKCDEEDAVMTEPDERTSLLGHNTKTGKSSSSSSSCCSGPRLTIVTAMVFKDMIKLIRNPMGLFFSFLVPLIQACLFCVCIGNDPTDLAMATVNGDTTPLQFGQQFLWNLDNNTIIQHPKENISVAVASAKAGNEWGTIDIPSNYSYYLIERFSGNIDNDTVSGSTIYVRLDQTNQQVYLTLQLRISDAFERFLEDLVQQYPMINPATVQVPLVFDDPIFGDDSTNFRDFMAPGIIACIIFFLAVSLTSVTFVVERKEGLLDRAWVAGVSALEVVISHAFVQFIVMTVQTTVVLVFILSVFDIANEGSLLLVVVLALMQGIVGMGFGMLISSISDNEVVAMQASLGSFFPLTLLSGIIWPLEGIPYPFRYFCLIMPQSYAVEALRGILGRGWNITFFSVYMGFISSFAWIIILLGIAALAMRLKR